MNNLEMHYEEHYNKHISSLALYQDLVRLPPNKLIEDKLNELRLKEVTCFWRNITKK
jgi:hypothetical protein